MRPLVLRVEGVTPIVDGDQDPEERQLWFERPSPLERFIIRARSNQVREHSRASAEMLEDVERRSGQTRADGYELMQPLQVGSGLLA